MNPPVIRPLISVQFPARGQGPRVTVQNFMRDEGQCVQFRTPKDPKVLATLGFTHVTGYPACFRRFAISTSPNDFDEVDALWGATSNYMAIRLYYKVPKGSGWAEFEPDTLYFLTIDNTYSNADLPRLDGFISPGIATQGQPT